METLSNSFPNQIKTGDVTTTDDYNKQSIDPLTIIGIGVAVAGAVTSIINTHKTNKANKELWEEQTAHNEAYNDPSAQRERLLNAGYSPMLGSFSSPILANGANPTQQTNNAGDMLSGLGTNIPNAIKSSAESDLIKEQTRGLKIENDNKQRNIDANLDKLYKDMELEDAQILSLHTSNEKMSAEIDALNREQDRKDVIAKWDKDFQDWQKENGSEKTRIDWYNSLVAERLADSNIGLNVEQQEALRAKVVETLQHTTLMYQQGENIDAETLSMQMTNFVRNLCFKDEIKAGKESAENTKSMAKLRNNAFCRAMEWTTSTFGALLGGVGAAAIHASKGPAQVTYSHYNDFRR